MTHVEPPMTLVEEVMWILSDHPECTPELYDEVAGNYGAFRQLWLDLAGARTEQAMLDDLGEVLHGAPRVLDAGCGTGAMAREVLQRCPTARVSMVDASQGMLAHTSDVDGERYLADVTDLPFDDDVFDVVLCSWVIETLDDPRVAVSGLLRVLKPEGFLLYTFCSFPGGWLSTRGSVFLRRAVERGFAGRFLDSDEQPWHDCDRSRRVSFYGGLSTYVLLRKCCTVEEGVLPPLVQAAVPPTLL